MFDEYLEPPRVERSVSPAPAVPVPVNSAGTPSSTTIDQDAPSPSHSPSSSALQSLCSQQGVAAGSTIIEDNPFATVDNDPFVNVFAPEPSSKASSSGDVSSTESTHVTQPHHHLGKWCKDYPLDNVIGNPSRPVSTIKQFATDALWCLYNFVLSKVKPKNFKSAITEDCWFQAMQDEIHKFDRLQARLMAKGYRQEEGIDFKESFAPVACIEAEAIKHLEVLNVGLAVSLRKPFIEGLWVSENNAMALTAYADADHADTLDEVTTYRLWALPLIKFPCIVITAVPSLSAAIMSSTPSPSTLTYDTISFESRLRRAWLNFSFFGVLHSDLAEKEKEKTDLKFLAKRQKYNSAKRQKYNSDMQRFNRSGLSWRFAVAKCHGGLNTVGLCKEMTLIATVQRGELIVVDFCRWSYKDGVDLFRSAFSACKKVMKLLKKKFVGLGGKLSKLQNEEAQDQTNIQEPRKLWGKLIQKLLLNQKCMGYLVRAYYSISPTSFQDTQLIQKLRDDKKYMKKVEPSSRSKTIEDIISIGSFVEAIILNHYVLVRKILGIGADLGDNMADENLDENWFTLDANLLREALEITPIDQAHQFVSPLLGDAIMDFVNELGYTEVIHFVSRMAVNNLYQPWRVILSMINQCLTGKTSGYDRPIYLVLQMLWGIIISTNVDYAELLWEEFVQAIQTFLTDKANLGSPTKKGRKDKPHVIPYCWFTKLIICHLGRTHNIHQRSASSFHLAEEDLRLGNLKFVPKGEEDEVFGMPIPNELILNNIMNAPYYNAYLEMVAKHDKKIAAEKEGKKKPATVKQPKSKPAKEKSSKPTPAPKPKITKEKPSKPSPAKHPKRGKVQKLRKGKPSLKLIDEDEPTQPEPEPES
ncbi:hypothetical protein Tco_0026315 [Tanacetum coccineum]